ncbi:hypothetical protein [Prevotella sp. tf2-5]|uniref:hypothetical protein n=1 Tax=Prevotella sp. tf2-5 TaxID=1761889 RepID=UPI0011601CE2|nr:hypothetical protein [Prevotella sp. tf2-5]
MLIHCPLDHNLVSALAYGAVGGTVSLRSQCGGDGDALCLCRLLDGTLNVVVIVAAGGKCQCQCSHKE